MSAALPPALERSASSGSTTPVPRLISVPRGFAGEEGPEVWSRLRATPRPDELEQPVSSLRGVGPALSKRLDKLGLSTVGELLLHRPHRYETAVPERRIAGPMARRAAAIAGGDRGVPVRRAPRNPAAVHARGGRATRQGT